MPKLRARLLEPGWLAVGFDGVEIDHHQAGAAARHPADVDAMSPLCSTWAVRRCAEVGVTPPELPAIDAPIPIAEAIAWEPMVTALAAQRPLWEPGTEHLYHGLDMWMRYGSAMATG